MQHEQIREAQAGIMADMLTDVPPHKSAAMADGLKLAGDLLRQRAKRLVNAADHVDAAYKVYLDAMENGDKAKQEGVAEAFCFALREAISANS